MVVTNKVRKMWVIMLKDSMCFVSSHGMLTAPLDLHRAYRWHYKADAMKCAAVEHGALDTAVVRWFVAEHLTLAECDKRARGW